MDEDLVAGTFVYRLWQGANQVPTGPLTKARLGEVEVCKALGRAS